MLEYGLLAGESNCSAWRCGIFACIDGILMLLPCPFVRPAELLHPGGQHLPGGVRAVCVLGQYRHDMLGQYSICQTYIHTYMCMYWNVSIPGTIGGMAWGW